MAEILLCSAEPEDVRFVLGALEQLGHHVVVESPPSGSLSAFFPSRYDAVVVDLASLDLAEGELLNAARALQSRPDPGLLVLGVAAEKLPRFMRQSRIIVLPAPFTPSHVVDALAPLHAPTRSPSGSIQKLTR